MAKLRNIGPHEVSLYAPEGEDGALLVEPGQTVDVPGELVTDLPDQPDDCLIIRGADGEPRAWATGLWEDAETAQQPESPAKQRDAENHGSDLTASVAPTEPPVAPTEPPAPADLFTPTQPAASAPAPTPANEG